MSIRLNFVAALLTGAGLLGAATVLAAGPGGAKALFDSGEGTTVGMSVGTPAAKKETRVASKPAPVKEKYVGISYQLMVLSDDGRMSAVSKNRVFRTGERVKIVARTNRPGYLAVLNRGTSGQTHVLYHEYVDAFSLVEIPRGTNMRFVGAPGKEDIVLMLSDQPNPIAMQAGKPAAGGMPSQSPPAGTYSAGYDQPAATSSYPSASTGYGGSGPGAPGAPGGTGYGDGRGYSAGGYSAPATQSASDSYYGQPAGSGGQAYGPAMMASLDGAKGMRGAKDLVVEDGMANSFAVVSPKHGFRPMQGGAKDLVLESDGGTHYGVVPVSAVSDGGLLTLKITLSHR